MKWGNMALKRTMRLGLLAAAGIAGPALTAPAAAQLSSVSVAEDVHAGELAVPINKSQVLRSDRPYAKALVGNPEIADVLPLTDQSLYVLGKRAGTTSLTLYDRSNMLIAVVDVVVGPDVTSLKRQLSELMPGSAVGARISNAAVVLEGIVPNAVVADRAVQLAETYAPGKVVNLMSIGASQQVMLEVRFAEVKRSAIKQIGVSWFGDGDDFRGVIGGGAGLRSGGTTTTSVTDPVTNVTTTTSVPNAPELVLGAITDSFGIATAGLSALGLNLDVTLDALERKGAVNTLAEPTLIALSGETASFLAGGEFPVPVVQSGGGGGGGGDSGTALTVEWKPFGVSLAFTPTVLADGVINLVVAPEVSSIDPSASIVINNLTVPGLQTRRAKTTVELRDGESFALAGLLRRDFQDTIRQVPLLGSIPIIGSLFRSSGFQREETELVIIVTPRLVRPVPAGTLRAPTDRAGPPHEADLFLLGRTDKGAPPAPPPFNVPAAPPPPPAATMPPPPGGMAAREDVGLEKEYGHVL